MLTKLRVPSKYTMAEYTVVLYVAWTVLNTVADGFNGIPGAIVSVATLIRSIMYIFLLAALFMGIRRIKKGAFIGYILIFALLLINYLSYYTVPERLAAYMNSLLLLSIPMSLIVNNLDDNRIVNKLAKLGVIINLVYFVLLIGSLAGMFSVKGYDTGIGYSALISEMSIILKIKRDKVVKERLVYLASIVVYCALVLLYGSRGPLVVLILFTIFAVIAPDMSKEKLRSNLGRYIIAIIVIVPVFIMRNRIIMSIGYMLQNKGLSSRTITLMVSDTEHLSGRDSIYSLIWEEIKKDPFRFRGIASDTLIISGNQYTHNLVLELLYEFGLIIGLVALGIICFKIFYCFRRGNIEVDAFLFILMFACIPQLMFSSTIWMNFIFWMWLFKDVGERLSINDE